MKKVRNMMIVFSITILMFMVSINTIFAARGIWSSSTRTDYDGVSTVGTVYNSGGKSSESVTLYVRTSSGAEVGKLSTAIKKGQKASHQCWGQPFLGRYGSVVISYAATHSPYFYE